jgi:hypothetical protein
VRTCSITLVLCCVLQFNVQRSLEQQQQASSSVASLPPSIDVYHAHHSSHHSSAGSVSSGGGGVGSPGSPPVSVLRHKEEDTAAGGSSGEGTCCIHIRGCCSETGVWHVDISTAICLPTHSVKKKLRFEVITAVTMMNAVFWDIKPSSYLTGDTLRLRYRVQPVNVMYDLRLSRRSL